MRAVRHMEPQRSARWHASLPSSRRKSPAERREFPRSLTGRGELQVRSANGVGCLRAPRSASERGGLCSHFRTTARHARAPWGSSGLRLVHGRRRTVLIYKPPSQFDACLECGILAHGLSSAFAAPSARTRSWSHSPVSGAGFSPPVGHGAWRKPLRTWSTASSRGCQGDASEQR